MYVPGGPSLRIVPPRPPEFRLVRLAFNKQSRHEIAPVTTTRFVPTAVPPRESKLDRMQAEHEFDDAIRRYGWAVL